MRGVDFSREVLRRLKSVEKAEERRLSKGLRMKNIWEFSMNWKGSAGSVEDMNCVSIDLPWGLGNNFKVLDRGD